MLAHLFALLSIVLRFGNATTFSSSALDPVGNPDDRLACVHRRLDVLSDACVALPARVAACGQRVVLVSLRSLRAVSSFVCDRGPRRALVDLTPALARRLGAHGREPVLLLVLPVAARAPAS